MFTYRFDVNLTRPCIFPSDKQVILCEPLGNDATQDKTTLYALPHLVIHIPTQHSKAIDGHSQVKLKVVTWTGEDMNQPEHGYYR